MSGSECGYTLEDALLWAESYKTTRSYSAVGKRYGVNHKAVARILRKYCLDLHLSLPDPVVRGPAPDLLYTREDVERWLTVYNKTHSILDVARVFEINRYHVTKMFNIFKNECNIKPIKELNQIEAIRGKRVCSVCGLAKDLQAFTKHSWAKCSECNYAKQMDWIKRNSAHVAERVRTRRWAGCVALAISNGRRRCKDCFRVFDETNFYKSAYKYKDGNFSRKARCRACFRQKFHKNVNFKLAANLRSRLNDAIANNRKGGSAVRDLGCSIWYLKYHLENQFYDNQVTGDKMSWENYTWNGWHVDHIIPLCSFDLTKRDEVLRACHYTNLQPLWAKENMSKGGKIV